MLPTGDHTPPDYELPLTAWSEQLKKPLRRLVYPAWNALIDPYLAMCFAEDGFRPDLWLWGQRGNDYERQRRRVNHFKPLAGSDVLVAGCGTGRDVDSWVAMNPRRVSGLDWFSYDKAWGMWRERFAQVAPEVEVRFGQADLSSLDGIPEASFDVVGSDAVFEHLRDLPSVLGQFHRILRPGGVLYATFGPLWHAWGGDHVSGYDALESGFNHLLLDHEAWQEYLDGIGERAHSEHDGRTWIEHDLFSRLRPVEYLDRLHAAGFKRRFVGAIIDPRVVAFLKQHPEKAQCLLARHSVLDLVVSGMTVIFQRG